MTNPAPVVQIKTTTGGTFFARADDVQAARRGGHRDVALCQRDGSAVAPGGRATLRLTTIEAAVVEPVVAPEPVQQPQAQQPPVEPSTVPPTRSIWMQIVRVISGEARREREAAEAQARAHAKAEQERDDAERQAQAKAQADETRRQERREQFRVIVQGLTDSDLPLIHFSTFHQPPQRHYAWRQHWLEALDDKGTLPTCNAEGELLIDDAGEPLVVSYDQVQWQTLRALLIQQSVRVKDPTVYQSTDKERKRGPKLR